MNFIFIKVGQRNIKILLEEILYVQAKTNCSKFFLTRNRSYTTYSIIKNLESTLPKDQFCRIHKSYIISLKHLTAFDKDSAYIEEIELPIGDVYKKVFLSKMSPLAQTVQKQPGKVRKISEKIRNVAGDPALVLN